MGLLTPIKRLVHLPELLLPGRWSGRTARVGESIRQGAVAHLLKELLACWIANVREKVLEGIKVLPHEPCERQDTVVLEAGQLAASVQLRHVRCSEEKVVLRWVQSSACWAQSVFR